MSEHDDTFDASGLRRLNKPHRPSEEAGVRMRQAMLAAFDASASDQPTEPGLQLVADESVQPRTDAGAPPVYAVELRPSADRRDLPRRPHRAMFLAAVAAVVAALIATGVVARDRQNETDIAEQNDALVETFCAAKFNELVNVVADFHRTPGGERNDRAMRNLELLAQAYSDLGTVLDGAPGAQVSAAGPGFLERAAEVRQVIATDSSSTASTALAALAADIAQAVEEVPGSQSCRVTDLSGD